MTCFGSEVEIIDVLAMSCFKFTETDYSAQLQNEDLSNCCGFLDKRIHCEK